jgi:isoleucyl-tRNA synthetase
MPYVAEMLYGGLGRYYRKPTDPESVHLTPWPKVNKRLIEKKLFKSMEEIRRLASLALAKRAELKIRVRQPLGVLRVQRLEVGEFNELLGLLKDEVNVKQVLIDSAIKSEIELDTTLTSKLREEGLAREIVRHVQELRRDAGLKPVERVRVGVARDRGAVDSERREKPRAEVIAGLGEPIPRHVAVEVESIACLALVDPGAAAAEVDVGRITRCRDRCHLPP